MREYQVESEGGPSGPPFLFQMALHSVSLKFLAATALYLLSLAACVQLPAATDLPAALRAHISNERFAVVTSIRGLPLGVRDELQKMFGGSLDIADPGTPVNSAAARRLVAAGCARDNHCFVHYEIFGRSPEWRVALFHWTPETTRFEWGAVAPAGLSTIDDVRRAVLSGAMQAASTW